MLTNLNQNRLFQTISQIKSLGNPQMMIQQMPQYKQIMSYINANGGDPKTAFYKKAQEMGFDPEEVLKAVRNA